MRRLEFREENKMRKNPFESLIVGEDPIRSLKRKLNKICIKKNLTEIDLTQGNPIGKISREYAEKLIGLIRKEECGESLSNSYCSSQGYQDFLIAISKLERKINNINISANHILAIPGAGEGIATLLCGLKEESETGEIILLTPFFPAYKSYVKHFGFTSKIVEFELNENLLLNRIKEKISDSTRAIIINSPNNPSGIVYSQYFLNKIGEVLNKNSHVLAISDEPYRELVLPDRNRASVISNLNYDNTVVVYSFSKEGRIAGCRIGYIALHPKFPNYEKVIEALTNTLTERGVIQASTREQMALSQCKLPLTIDWNDTMNLMKILFTDLSNIGYELIEPNGGLFICVKSPDKNGMSLHERLMDIGLGTVPGEPFGIKEYVRLSICGVTRKNYNKILNGFKDIYLSFK